MRLVGDAIKKGLAERQKSLIMLIMESTPRMLSVSGITMLRHFINSAMEFRAWAIHLSTLVNPVPTARHLVIYIGQVRL